MIIWGWQKRSINLSRRETHWCSNCGQQRPFSLFLQYACWRLYWIFGFVTSRRYMKQCSFCGGEWWLDSRKVDPSVHVPIPFMQRFGLLSLIAAITVVGIGSAVK